MSIFNFKIFNLSTNEGNLAINSKQVHVTQLYLLFSIYTVNTMYFIVNTLMPLRVQYINGTIYNILRSQYILMLKRNSYHSIHL